MAAQETYHIHETSKTVLREKDPSRRTPSDIAIIKSQDDRLLDLLYKDAERGFRYDTVEVKRYVLYGLPAGTEPSEFGIQDYGKPIGEFARLDMAEMVRDALNAATKATVKPRSAESHTEHAERQRLASEMNAKRDFGQPQI